MARSRSRRLLTAAVVAAAVAPAVLACNGILGLSDFEKVECAGLKCGDSEAPDVLAIDGGDASVDDAAPDARGADPVTWAEWPMPNYGDAGSVVLPNQLSYEAVGADARRDTVTKLVWQKALTTESAGYEQAVSACAALTANGPWRLPKRIELVTLLDFGRTTSPFIDPGFGVAKLAVWTSSRGPRFDDDNPTYWIVDFNTGEVQPRTATGSDRAGVLCVKAKAQ